MSNFDSDSSFENEGDKRGELARSEFESEQYLREQDEMIYRYLGFYEQLDGQVDRLDIVSRRMGWDGGSESTNDDIETLAEMLNEFSGEVDGDRDTEPYALHQNPVFIASRGIFLSLIRRWERLAENADRVPQALALSVHSALHRAEQQAILALSALEIGDYVMAISLFKRAISEVNQCFTLLGSAKVTTQTWRRFCDMAIPRLFDVREIWLGVMGECREDFDHPSENEE